MFSRQYSSLTGSQTFSRFADQTKVLEKPIGVVLTLESVKNFLRKRDDTDNEHILILLRGVTDQIERYCGVDLVTKTRLAYWKFPFSTISLPYGIHGDVLSVIGIDSQGDGHTLVSGVDYTVEGVDYKEIVLHRSFLSVTVTYKSGFDSCPEAIKAAILQELSFQYKNRSDANMGRIILVNGLTAEARNLLVAGGYYRYAR